MNGPLIVVIAFFNLMILSFNDYYIRSQKGKRIVIYIHRCKSRPPVLFQRQEDNYIIPHSCEEFNLSGSPSQETSDKNFSPTA